MTIIPILMRIRRQFTRVREVGEIGGKGKVEGLEEGE